MTARKKAVPRRKSRAQEATEDKERTRAFTRIVEELRGFDKATQQRIMKAVDAFIK